MKAKREAFYLFLALALLVLALQLPEKAEAQANCTQTEVQNGTAWHCDGDTFMFQDYRTEEDHRELRRLRREVQRLNEREKRPIWDNNPYKLRW